MVAGGLRDDAFHARRWSFFFDSTSMILCWGFKGVQEEIPRERRALFKSGQWHFHQDNAPVNNSILVTDYLTKIGIKTVPQPPIVQTLPPVTFGYSLSSRKNFEAVLMRQLRRWKRLWRSSLTRSHKRSSISCWNCTSVLQPEKITSKGTRVSCVYYQEKCAYENYLMSLVILFQITLIKNL